VLPFILDTLAKAKSIIWIILAVSLGITIVSTPMAIAYIVGQSSSIDITARGTEINLKGKEINDSVDELLLRLQALESANNELLAAAKNKKGLSEKVEKVEGAIAESTSIAEDLTTKQAELNTLLK
jgi:F420-0:gamma-glutamyl ligase-like protein